MNILVTNFNNTLEDVMIMFDSLQYPNITLDTIKRRLESVKATYDEIYQVDSSEVQYYIFDPCNLNDEILESLNHQPLVSV